MYVNDPFYDSSIISINLEKLYDKPCLFTTIRDGNSYYFNVYISSLISLIQHIKFVHSMVASLNFRHSAKKPIFIVMMKKIKITS